MVATTTLMLVAGRFGLAPSANRKATAGLRLEARDSGLQTGDPAGFTLADTLACGAVGVVLGLKNTGALDQTIGYRFREIIRPSGSSVSNVRMY
jgi:photosystem I subunit X